MTYLAEFDGMAVPASMTEGTRCHQEAAMRVATVTYPYTLITIEDGDKRLWFRVMENGDVEEVWPDDAGNVVKIGRAQP